jgi:hypothetical protein
MAKLKPPYPPGWKDGEDFDKLGSGETAGVLTFKSNRFSVEKQARVEECSLVIQPE